jgi:hypothetical protein
MAQRLHPGTFFGFPVTRPIYISVVLIPSHGYGGRPVKVKELIAHGIGGIIGVVLGIAGFLKLYLPLKAGLGLDFAASQASNGEGPIVPMKTFVPLYLTAGAAIDLIVLLAFIIAGICGIFGILQALRKKS